MPTPTYDLIASNVLGSSASSIEFASIGSSYRDLIVVCEVLGASSSAANLAIQFNSDTGSNYSAVVMSGNGSTATSSSTTTTSISGFGSDGTTRVLTVFQVMDYATDKHKSVLSRSNRADSVVQARAARWANTAAINSVTLTDSLANGYAAGSSFYLYGIVS
jgi:hypothetical protein